MASFLDLDSDGEVQEEAEDGEVLEDGEFGEDISGQEEQPAHSLGSVSGAREPASSSTEDQVNAEPENDDGNVGDGENDKQIGFQELPLGIYESQCQDQPMEDVKKKANGASDTESEDDDGEVEEVKAELASPMKERLPEMEDSKNVESLGQLLPLDHHLGEKKHPESKDSGQADEEHLPAKCEVEANYDTAEHEQAKVEAEQDRERELPAAEEESDDGEIKEELEPAQASQAGAEGDTESEEETEEQEKEDEECRCTTTEPADAEEDASSCGESGSGKEAAAAAAEIPSEAATDLKEGTRRRRRKKRRRRSASASDHPHRRRRHRRTHLRCVRTRRARLVARTGRRRRTKATLLPHEGAQIQLQREKVDRSLREVYVGGLAWTGAKEEVITDAFTSAFKELDDYRLRYKDVKSPVVSVHFPPPPSKRPKTHNTSTFVFVEFFDRLLARTALQFSGLRIGGRSTRICPPSAGVDLAGSTLDIEPLRRSEALPHCSGPGSQLHTHVWLGNLPARYGREEQRKMLLSTAANGFEPNSVGQHIDTAIRALPSVRARYPDMTTAVHSLRISECGRFAFLEAATERIASTLVAETRLDLATGIHLKTGWPVGSCGAEERAAPPITADGGDGELLHVRRGRGIAEPSEAVVVVEEDDFLEKMECEVFLGGILSLKARTIWGALADQLMALPAYQREYSNLESPIINVRLGVGPFGFARLADARLASTAVALEEIIVQGKKVHICRPSSFNHDHFVEKPLDLTPALPKPPAPPSEPPPPPKRLQPLRPPPPPQAIVEIPPAPPKVPHGHTLWIGNLPRIESIDKLSDDEDDMDDGNLNCKETRLLRRLDRHVAGLAMSVPGYELEEGPPLKRISVHHSGRFAFAEVLGSQERVEELLSILDGSIFLGRPLFVNWTRNRLDYHHLRRRHRERRLLSQQFPVASIPPGLVSVLPGAEGHADAPGQARCSDCVEVNEL